MTSFVFICRRCGTSFVGDTSPLPPGVALAQRLNLALYAVHNCCHGGAGLADLNGAIPTPAPSPEVDPR